MCLCVVSPTPLNTHSPNSRTHAAPAYNNNKQNSDDPKEKQRQRLAQLIAAEAARQQKASGGKGPQLYVVDASAGPLNFNAMTETEWRLYVDDGLHLSARGYDMLGKLVYDEINKHMCTAA